MVTSPYHSRRALWVFRRVLEPAGVEVGIDSPPPGEQSPQPRDVVAQQNRMAQRRARVRQARVLPDQAWVRAGSRRSPGRRIDVSFMVDGRSIPRRSSSVGATADRGTLSAW